MLKKVVIGGVIFFVLLVVVLIVGVKIALPPEKVAALVSEHGSKALGRELKVEGGSVSILSGLKVKVENVYLDNAEGFSADPLFKIESIELSLGLFSIFQGSPTVKEIRLVRPDFLYEVNEKGVTNLEGLGGEKDTLAEPEPDTSDSEPLTSIPSALAIKEFNIENAQIRFLDKKAGTSLIIKDINQTISVSVDKNLEDIQTRGKLRIFSLSYSDKTSGTKTGGLKISLNHQIGVNLKEQTIQIGELELGLQDITLNAGGLVKNFMGDKGPLGLDLKLASNKIKMGSLLKEVPANLSPDIPKLSASGHAMINASVVGTVDSVTSPRIKADIDFENMAFSHSDLPAGINGLNAKIRYTENSLDIPLFKCNLDQHPIDITVALNNLKNTPFLKNLNVNSRVDLGKLMALVDKFVGLPDDFELSGNMQTKISASGLLDPNKPQGIKANGQVNLKKVRLKTEAIPEPVQLTGSLEVDNDLIKNKLRVEMAGSDLKLNASITDYLAFVLPDLAKGKLAKINAKIYSQNLNLDKILPTPSEEKKPEPEDGPPMTEYPELPNVHLTLNMQLEKTKLMDLEMTGFEQKLTLINSIISSNLKGRLYTGSFSNSLNVDLRNRKDAKIKMNLNVNKVEANDFISRLNDKLPMEKGIAKTLMGTDNTIYGKLSIKTEKLKTNGLPQNFMDNLSGRIHVDLDKGKLVNVNMVKQLSGALSKLSSKLAVKDFSYDHMEMDLEAKDGKLIVKHLDVNKSPIGAIFAGGWVAFNNDLNLKFDQVLPKSISSTILGKTNFNSISGLSGLNTLPTSKDGRAMVYYKVGGTILKPKFEIDKKRMASGVKDQLMNAVKDRANKEKKKVIKKAKTEVKKVQKKAEKAAKKEVKKAEKKVKKKVSKEAKKALGKIKKPKLW